MDKYEKEEYISIYNGDIYSVVTEEEYKEVKAWLKENTWCSQPIGPKGSGDFLINLDHFVVDTEEELKEAKENEEDGYPYVMFKLVFKLREQMRLDPNKQDYLNYPLNFMMEAWN